MSDYITGSYALKYYGECMNYRRQRSRVEIWVKGSVDSSYPRAIGDITGLSLAINGNEDIDAPVVKTILNLTMADTWDEAQASTAYATKHGAWEEFYTPDSTAYLVKLFTAEYDDVNWTHRWSGYITPDNWHETIGYRGGVGIVARDNLGHLQDFDFDLEGDSNGMVSVYDIIVGAFTKIAFPMDVVIGCDAIANDRALLYEAGHGTGSKGIYDALVLVSELEGEDWGTALESVLDSLGITIRFVDNNTVVVTEIRNLPLCGTDYQELPQTVEFYGPGTRTLVPAYREVKITTDFDYEQEIGLPAKVRGSYINEESFHWMYFDTRRQQTVSGDALRSAVTGMNTGWYSAAQAFVDPSSYYITQRGGGAAVVDIETTALLIANASAETVRMAAAIYTVGRVNTPAAVMSLEVTASFVLSGRYLLRSGSLTSYEWAALYTVGGVDYWWNGSQWKSTQTWTETTENKMDFSAPMNLRDIDEGGFLTIFIRNVKATTGFCIGVSSVVLTCNEPATSLKADIVKVVNDTNYNVRAERTPNFGCLSKPVVWNVPGNYPNVFWHYDADGLVEPFPYETVWSDGTELLALPVQWAKQTLMFHHSTLQMLEGTVGVVNKGMWMFDRPILYKNHHFLQQGGTFDLLTGHVTGLSLREYIDFAVLWQGAASVSPQLFAFNQEGGSASFLVSCADDKEWFVTGLPSWLSADVDGGTGSGIVTLTCEVNDAGARTRTIFIAGVAIYISQSQRSFGLSVIPASLEAPLEGRSQYVTVTASTGEAWKLASSDPTMILVNAEDEWEDEGYNDAVLILVQENETGSDRTGYLYLYDGEDNLVQTVPVVQSTGGGTTTPTLTITTNVSSPTITLEVNGSAVTYTPGMEVPQGSLVSVTISKTGYATLTDTFTMPMTATEKVYTLSQEIWATASWPNYVTSSAQNVPVTISDPAGHGWILSWQQEGYRGYITGGSVVSGNATVYTYSIAGTGDAVVTLAVKANTGGSRKVGADPAPIYFWDEVRGASYKDTVWFWQLSPSASQTLVTSVSLNKNSMSKNVGESEQLTATVLPNDATNKTLAWTSSNSSIASVDQDGTVHALGAGTATITASATDGSGKYATCTVTVTGTSVPVTGVSLNRATLSLNTGETSALTATVAPATATNKSVTWASSNTSVATVSSSGVVTAVGAGSATITVTTQDGGFTASCAVTVSQSVSGSMSAEDVTVLSIAGTAASQLTVSGMNLASLAASCNAQWVTAARVDTSGSTPYVRLTIWPNTSQTGRSATVTVTGTSLTGNPVTTTFTLTQTARDPSDLPCESMGINGPDYIMNSQNEAIYNAEYVPQLTTQDACTFTLTDANGNSVAGRVNMTVQYDAAILTVVDTTIGAGGLALKLKVTNYYDSSVYYVKEITAYYTAPAASLEVNPGSVSLAADATSDRTPVVTFRNGLTASDLTITKSGIITGANILSGRLATVFPANDTMSAKSGSVQIRYTDPLSGSESLVVVTYTQMRKSSVDVRILPIALNISESGGTVTAKMLVNYRNNESGDFTFRGLGYVITGYDANDTEVFTHSGNLAEKTVAGMALESERYTETWTGSLGASTHYTLTVHNGTQQSGTITSDGNDFV